MAVRDWSDTETLTSAAWDEVMTSGHMVFADAAARDAMLVDDLTPVAGMRVFMLDSNLLLTYIVVGGQGYWAPQPGTLIFNSYQAASQTLPAGTAGTGVVIKDFTLIGGRNFGSWLNVTTGRFLPLCPGWYEFFGTVNQTGYNIQYGRGGFRSEASFGHPMPMPWTDARAFFPSGSAMPPGLGVVIPVNRYQQYMNGTTDWMELVLNQQGTQSTIVTAGYQCQFGAKYLGA